MENQTAKPRAIKWRITILDAGGGSEDGLIELPDELLAQLGWQEGEPLSVSVNDSGYLLIERVQPNN